MTTEDTRISSGSHSINLNGGSITNSTLHIGDVQGRAPAAAQVVAPVAEIRRTHVRPLIIAGHPVKAGWLATSGALGFLGSIASIVGLWQHLSFWFVLALAVSVVVLVSGLVLLRHRFFRLTHLPYNLESDHAGRVFLTAIAGDCPVCDGKLKLRDVGPKDRKVTIVRCTRNPRHSWGFDFTVLGDPES